MSRLLHPEFHRRAAEKRERLLLEAVAQAPPPSLLPPVEAPPPLVEGKGASECPQGREDVGGQSSSFPAPAPPGPEGGEAPEVEDPSRPLEELVRPLQGEEPPTTAVLEDKIVSLKEGPGRRRGAVSAADGPASIKDVESEEQLQRLTLDGLKRLAKECSLAVPKAASKSKLLASVVDAYRRRQRDGASSSDEEEEAHAPGASSSSLR